MSRSSIALLVVSSLAFLHATGILAQDPAKAELESLRSEIENLEQGQAAIRKELAEIKDLLLQRPVPGNAAPTDVVLDLGERPVKGSRDAKLAVVEFSDYQCPYCARYFRHTYPQLAREFIDPGKVLYAVMDFPLSNHPHAFKAAEAAACAEEQGKFWEMHHILFENHTALPADALPGYADAIGLDRGRFEQCLEAGKAESVQADLADGRRAGVNATPTFLIGRLGDDGTTVEVTQRLRGAQPFPNFQRILSQLLAREPGPGEADGD